jgi:hypothetical protein
MRAIMVSVVDDVPAEILGSLSRARSCCSVMGMHRGAPREVEFKLEPAYDAVIECHVHSASAQSSASHSLSLTLSGGKQ